MDSNEKDNTMDTEAFWQQYWAKAFEQKALAEAAKSDASTVPTAPTDQASIFTWDVPDNLSLSTDYYSAQEDLSSCSSSSDDLSTLFWPAPDLHHDSDDSSIEEETSWPKYLYLIEEVDS